MSNKNKFVIVDVKSALIKKKNIDYNHEQARQSYEPESEHEKWLIERIATSPCSLSEYDYLVNVPTIELPKSVDKDQTIAQRVEALANQSNGNRPMVMTSHMANHKPVRKKAKTPYEKHVFSHTYDNLDDRSYDEGWGPLRWGSHINNSFYHKDESERIRDGKTRAQVKAEESEGRRDDLD